MMMVNSKHQTVKKCLRPGVVEQVDELLAFDTKDAILDYLRRLTSKALEKNCPAPAATVPPQQTERAHLQNYETKQQPLERYRPSKLSSEPAARLRDVRAMRQQVHPRFDSEEVPQHTTQQITLLRAIFDRAKTSEQGSNAHTAACALTLEHDLALHDLIGKRQALKAASHIANLSQPIISFTEFFSIIEQAMQLQ